MISYRYADNIYTSLSDYLCINTYYMYIRISYSGLFTFPLPNLGISEAAQEDHDVLIIITLVVVLSLICLLCTLCHSRRKRRNHVRQLGLHRNAHYDSQTSATGKHCEGLGINHIGVLLMFSVLFVLCFRISLICIMSIIVSR